MPARATATSCASSRPTTRRWRSSPISAASRSAWPSTATTISMSASAAWGSTASRPTRKVEKVTDETNRSLLLGQRRQPAAARRRPRHRRRRPHLLLRSDRPLRDARMAGRRAGGARQRPHHLLRSEHRHDAHRAARAEIPQRHLHRQRRPVDPVRRDLRLLRSSATGSTARRPARSRWSSTICRAIPTTSISPRTATTGWRMVGMRSPALDLAWKMPGFRKRMGKRVPIDEWLFPNINTGCVIKFNEQRRGARIVLGPARREPSDDHLDARASRLSLSRRHHATTASADTNSSNADPNFVQYDRRWGKQR